MAYGGGGDGGAEQMREDERERQRKVQEAVDAINGKFGHAPAKATNLGPAPAREQFIRPIRPAYSTPENTEAGNPVWHPAQDGGFDDAGYNAALAGFAERKGAAAKAVTDVSGAKIAREKMYTDISGAVKDTAMRDLDRQYSKASQRNKFGLARSGLLGGSVDAESGGELTTLYGEGKLKATEAGKGAASDLRVNDEKTRQNLIGLAQGGMDTGTAASLAAGQMGAAAELARSQTGTATVGRLFDDMSQAYVMNQYIKAGYPTGMPGQQPAGYSTSVFNPSRYFGTVGR